MTQKRVIYRDWVRGVGEGGESGGLSWGNQLFGHPDVVGGGFCEKVSPVGGFSSFDGLKVAEFGLCCHTVGFGGPEPFGSERGFHEFLSESGQERGPAGFGSWGRARVGCRGFDCRCECGEGCGEPLVELVGGGGIGGGRDEPVFESLCEAWPVALLPARPGSVVVGGGRAYSK